MTLKYLQKVSTLQLDPKRCNGCKTCQKVCPHGVFEIAERRAIIKEPDACMECGACANNCEQGALSVRAGVGCAAAIINGALKRDGACCCEGTGC